MDNTKLTKEQTSLFTVIAAIVMLLAFFVFKFSFGFGRGITPWEILTKGGIGFLGYVFLILFLLMPIYLILYAYRDAKPLEPLKPILGLPSKWVYAAPLILWSILVVYMFIEMGAAAAWVYLIAAVAAFFIGAKS